MSLASARLPADPDALRALAVALQAELADRDLAIAVRDAEIHAKTLHIEKLKAQLAIVAPLLGGAIGGFLYSWLSPNEEPPVTGNAKRR